MKILQIAPPWINTPPKDYGGTEWVISNLTKGLTDLGHKVTLFATKKSHSAGSLKYLFSKSLVEMNVPWSSALPALIHYHKAVNLKERFDIIHAHLSSSTDLAALLFLSDLNDKYQPNIITIHGHAPFDRYSKMDDYYLKAFSRKILAVNISKTMQKYLPRYFRDGGFVHNSLDPSTIKFNPKKGKYLTWLGKIIPDKGTHLAILAAKSAGEQLIFAGIVDKFQEISVRYFKEKVKPLIDGKQIIFLGPADMKMKNKMLGGAKGFLNPINWEEPFGMVMAESMAAGTPIISFNRGAAPELIRDGVTGFLVNTLQEMVKVIPKLDNLNRVNSRQHIEDNFSPLSAAEGYLKVYSKEIKRNKERLMSKIKQTRHNLINSGYPQRREESLITTD